MDLTETEPKPREPIFQSPWTVVGLVGFILACFLAQKGFGLDAVANAWGLSSAALGQGHWATLVTAIFLHGGWAHVLVNSAFILAFGTPVARRMGTGPAGAAAFFGFFLVCGVAGNLTFAALQPHGEAIGASGAASGLIAAASRLMTPYRRLAPFFSQPVIVMALAFLVGNLIIAVVGWAPGAGDAQVAWQAHLGGYACGLVLFAPLLALLRRE